jgi:hypothetical protein
MSCQSRASIQPPTGMTIVKPSLDSRIRWVSSWSKVFSRAVSAFY